MSETFPVADDATNEFEAVVREHSKVVYRVAYSILRNHHDAEDATQETFIRCLRWWKRLDPGRDRRAWLVRTAWRLALDRRPRHREVSLDDEAQVVLNLHSAGASADEMAVNQQMQSLLTRMIASLPADLREPLMLSTVEELTSPEIAAILGIPDGSVRTRLMRAREVLKEKLGAVLAGR